MTEISASLVKELRERTGSGMMECKKALMAAGGDIEKAIDEMRKAGQAKADKKASRIAAEGVVVISSTENGNAAVMLEVNSETDFVARDESFNRFVKEVMAAALSSGVQDVNALASIQLSSGETVDEARRNLIAKIGENIHLRRLMRIDTHGVVGSYVHGGRIGVLVELDGGNIGLAKDLAMHVAALNPMVVSDQDVPAEAVEREKEIFLAQAMESGKPKDIAEKMVAGRVRKFLEEVSLTGQAFVKDPSVRVSDLLKSQQAKVKRFVRFAVGEGIEKQEVDFAKEVMQQAGLA